MFAIKFTPPAGSEAPPTWLGGNPAWPMLVALPAEARQYPTERAAEDDLAAARRDRPGLGAGRKHEVVKLW